MSGEQASAAAMPERILTNVYSWPHNGMVTVFDQFGRQMPEYQGRKEDVWKKIQRDKRPETQIMEPAPYVSESGR